ncbi:hypothetical protein PoB_000632600 [Plakobranchus ocellatus]|uniref:Uncharacterized protein n=1 Tax=Plakobranchus ocellatus TaxID=259542 RepID=A0AAV3XXZ5_9GAST|nr:hypothetical protein PoB_000632600 [Plakobranchus ocellatus]
MSFGSDGLFHQFDLVSAAAMNYTISVSGASQIHPFPCLAVRERSLNTGNIRSGLAPFRRHARGRFRACPKRFRHRAAAIALDRSVTVD